MIDNPFTSIGSNRLCPNRMIAPSKKIIFAGRNTRADNIIRLMPIAQMICRIRKLKVLSNVQAKFTMVSSAKTSQIPRVKRNHAT